MTSLNQRTAIAPYQAQPWDFLSLELKVEPSVQERLLDGISGEARDALQAEVQRAMVDAGLRISRAITGAKR